MTRGSVYEQTRYHMNLYWKGKKKTQTLIYYI